MRMARAVWISAATLASLVIAGQLPALALAGLAGPAMFAAALARVRPEATLETFGNLTRAAAGAATVGGGVLALALLVSRWAGW